MKTLATALLALAVVPAVAADFSGAILHPAFKAVAGEQQGLLGAAHWARTARNKDLRIQAMVTNDIKMSEQKTV